MQTIEARVIDVHRGRIDVETPSGVVACRLRGRLTRTKSTLRTLVVVGDRVAITADDGAPGTGTIEEVLPRDTTVSRRAPGTIAPDEHGSGLSRTKRFTQHVLAANIDMAAAVVALLEPRFKPGTVSQFLAGAQAGGAAPLIILNKVDLGDRSAAVAALEPYRQAGVQCVLTSVVTGEGIAELATLLEGRWTLFYGQSGVGKSSLLNALCPDAAARTSAISSATHWGRHTTTGSRLYRLPLAGGGYVIDTPGVRAFSFWEAPDHEGLDELFPDIAELAAECKFADCSHTHEPGCAVKAALEAGDIDHARYKHYVRLARSGRRGC